MRLVDLVNFCKSNIVPFSGVSCYPTSWLGSFEHTDPITPSQIAKRNYYTLDLDQFEPM